MKISSPMSAVAHGVVLVVAVWLAREAALFFPESKTSYRIWARTGLRLAAFPAPPPMMQVTPMVWRVDFGRDEQGALTGRLVEPASLASPAPDPIPRALFRVTVSGDVEPIRRWWAERDAEISLFAYAWPARGVDPAAMDGVDLDGARATALRLAEAAHFPIPERMTPDHRAELTRTGWVAFVERDEAGWRRNRLALGAAILLAVALPMLLAFDVRACVLSIRERRGAPDPGNET